VIGDTQHPFAHANPGIPAYHKKSGFSNHAWHRERGRSTLLPPSVLPLALNFSNTAAARSRNRMPPPCSAECTRNVLPSLPVLSDANRVTERAWHEYVANIYGAPLPPNQTLDLNEFTFFYTKRPEQHVTRPVFALLNAGMNGGCVAICPAGVMTRTYDGTPWVGKASRVGTPPAMAMAEIGFFVRRAFPSPSSLRSSCNGRIEVSHVETSFHGGEHGVAWFFHTRGSGIYLSCRHLPTRGRLVVHRSRQSFEDHEGHKWIDDIRFPQKWMRDHGVAMVIFTREDFRHWVTGAANPRTEIVVLLADGDAAERTHGSYMRTTCLSGVGFRAFSGWGGGRDCICDDTARSQTKLFFNCDGDTRPPRTKRI
jgi:hypothetical protein